MLVLSMKPLQKLTGTDRQAGRQADGRTDKPVYWEAVPPKIISGKTPKMIVYVITPIF